MATEGVSFDAALARVQLRRPVIQPNPGFAAQLRELECSRLLRELRAELASDSPRGDSAHVALDRGVEGVARGEAAAPVAAEVRTAEAWGGDDAALIAELC